MSTVLQAPLLTNFLYPLLLIFFATFAILEKTKVLGENSKGQTNALVALIIGLIFVGAVFPKIVVANLVQFMTVGLIVIFVGLMLWGFISGNKDLSVMDDGKTKIHKIFAFLVFGGVVLAVLWATGIGSGLIEWLQKFLALLFSSEWSSDFWTNFIFIAIVFVVVCVVLGWNPFKNKTNWWITLKK